MSDKNMVIDRDYISDMEKYVEEKSKSLNTMLNNYVAQLEYVISDCITSGDTKEVIEAFKNSAAEMKGNIEALGASTKSTITDFMSQVDEQDNYTFKED